MIRIMTAQKMITAPGEISILEPESSLKRVNPPPPDGIDILLSDIRVYFKVSIIYLSEFL